MKDINQIADEVTAFIIANRGKKVWPLKSEREIRMGIFVGLSNKTTLYTVNLEGEVDGVVQTTCDVAAKEIHVNNILCLKKISLQNFFIMFLNFYPGYKLTAVRKGKPITYNLSSFRKHLINQ